MNDPPRGLGGSSSRCAEEGHCITCSDEGVPMRVVEVGGDGLALCFFDGEPGSENAVPVEVQIDLVAPVMLGDELLVHAGVALLRLGGGSVRSEAAA
jgi:hydrogenase maturation factor